MWLLTWIKKKEEKKKAEINPVSGFWTKLTAHVDDKDNINENKCKENL